MAEVFARPRHPYTQGLLASVISLETDAACRPSPARRPTSPDPPPGCRFAPRCPLAMSACLEVAPVPAPCGPTGTGSNATSTPGADPRHPGRAWVPTGRRSTLAAPPLAGTLR